MNNQEAFVKLFAWRHWFNLYQAKGVKFGLPVLKIGFTSANKSLRSSPRDTMKRLILLQKCINCGKEVPISSTGDHIISKKKGGPDSLLNYEPLCRSCNSSKGDKDLLVWWIVQNGRSIEELNLDAFLVYLRLTYQKLEEENKLKSETPDFVKNAVQQAARTFPSSLRSNFENARLDSY